MHEWKRQFDQGDLLAHMVYIVSVNIYIHRNNPSNTQTP